MTRLWQEETRPESRVLRVATLERLGGAGDIVATHVDAALDALTDAERNAAARDLSVPRHAVGHQDRARRRRPRADARLERDADPAAARAAVEPARTASSSRWRQRRISPRGRATRSSTTCWPPPCSSGERGTRRQPSAPKPKRAPRSSGSGPNTKRRRPHGFASSGGCCLRCSPRPASCSSQCWCSPISRSSSAGSCRSRRSSSRPCRKSFSPRTHA